MGWFDDGISKEEYEKFRNKHKHIKDQVEYVLKNYPSSRNLDELLWWLVLKIFYPDVYREFRESVKRGYIPIEVLKKVPRFETVSRWRRKFNEQGLYLPTDPEVLSRRNRREKLWRRLMTEE